jgi:hypothetical protein
VAVAAGQEVLVEPVVQEVEEEARVLVEPVGPLDRAAPVFRLLI